MGHSRGYLGDPGKTNPQKCIEPPPQIKDPGGCGYPDPWIQFFSGAPRQKMYLGGSWQIKFGGR